MTISTTSVPLSDAEAHLLELVEGVRRQRQRIALTRNGETEAVLISVDDLEGLEMTVEILSDSDAVARILRSLAGLGQGAQGSDMATLRQDLAQNSPPGR